jgi:TRAP-type C4-dicarboxylate transport system permease small subunit
MSNPIVEVAPRGIDCPVDEVRGGTPARALQFADKVLGALAEVPSALLVVAEVGVLFGGVLSRYVLHTPLVWVDELASLLFIWLIMLGSAVAFRRGSHMRMTALVDKAGPQWRSVFELVATVAALAWLALVAAPAYEFASEEALVTLPALDISNAWRAAALPVGIALILLMSVVRLLTTARPRMVLVALAASGAVVGTLVCLQRCCKAWAMAICCCSSWASSACWCLPACPSHFRSDSQRSVTCRSLHRHRPSLSSAGWTKACRT